MEGKASDHQGQKPRAMFPTAAAASRGHCGAAGVQHSPVLVVHPEKRQMPAYHMTLLGSANQPGPQEPGYEGGPVPGLLLFTGDFEES